MDAPAFLPSFSSRLIFPGMFVFSPRKKRLRIPAFIFISPFFLMPSQFSLDPSFSLCTASANAKNLQVLAWSLMDGGG